MTSGRMVIRALYAPTCPYTHNALGQHKNTNRGVISAYKQLSICRVRRHTVTALGRRAGHTAKQIFWEFRANYDVTRDENVFKCGSINATQLLKREIYKRDWPLQSVIIECFC